MGTFALCTALSNVAQTFERAQAIIGQQRLERVPDEADRAWWLDARSLVQRCRSLVGSETVWSWLQAASQEPDAGPLSWRAAATARSLRQPLVSWPGKPQVRHPGQCTLTGHSAQCDLGGVLAGRQAHRQRVLGQHREGLGFSDRQGGECPTLSSPNRLLLCGAVLTSVFGP